MELEVAYFSDKPREQHWVKGEMPKKTRYVSHVDHVGIHLQGMLDMLAIRLSTVLLFHHIPSDPCNLDP